MADLSPIVEFKKLQNTKAWKLTSELVRKLAKGRCYTCDRRVGFESLSAGHFIEKIGNARVYFNLDNLRAQCYFCNRMKHGARDVYSFKLLKEIGIDRFNDLKTQAQKGKQWHKDELDLIAEERQELLNQLK